MESIKTKLKQHSSKKNKFGIFFLLLGIWRHLNKKRKTQLSLLLVVMLFSAFGEVFSLTALLPFLTVLVSPENIFNNSIYQIFANSIRIINSNNILILLTLIFAFSAILAACIRLLNLWFNVKLAASIGTDLSCKAYNLTLNQPYEIHIQKNSSSIITTTITHTQQTVVAINLFLQLCTAIIVSIGLTIALLIVDYKVTLCAIIVFGIAYLFIALKTKNKLFTYSFNVADSTKDQLKTLQEGLGAIRDVILDKNQYIYVNKYRKADLKMRSYRARNQFIAAFPRYGLEAIGILLITFLAFLLRLEKGNSNEIIPILGAFALGAQKLLPTMQSSYKSWSLLYFYNKPLNRVLELIKLKSTNYNKIIKDKLSFQRQIKITNLSFNYKSNKENISKNINLTINKGENLGIFGKTGSGKTTLINILMGILSPNSGNIFIDDKDLFNINKTNLLKKWKNNISLVPQDIFLFDASITENIAFCVPKEKIEFQRVVNAAKIACAHEFISKTANGYQTFVGDKGIKLSGGQKQRIGLARAIYSNSELLILDESTSALDFKTEKSVIESIFNKNSNSNLTTITIAHRLSTLRYCDKIIELKDGSINGLYNNKEYVEKFKNLF